MACLCNQNQNQIFISGCWVLTPVSGIPPAVPTNVDLDDASVNGSTIVTWSNSDVPTTNELWRSKNGGAYALIATVPGTQHNATDGDVLGGNDFWTYKVRACNGAACSAYSGTASAANGIDQNGGVAVTVSYPDLVLNYSDTALTLMPNVTSLDFPRMRRTSFLGFNDDPALTSESFPVLAFATNLSFGNCTALTSLTFPALVVMAGAISGETTGLTLFSAANLVGEIADCSFANSASLSTVFLPGVQIIDNDLNLSNTGAIAVNLPALTSIGNDLNCQSSGVTSISLAALTSVGSAVRFGGCASLTSIAVDQLQTVGTGIEANNCVVLSQALFNALTTVGGVMNFNGDSSLTTLNTANLISVASDLVLAGIGAAAVSFPALTTIGGLFDFSASGITSMSTPVLAAVSQVAYLNANSVVTLSFPALAGTVNDWNGSSCAALIGLHIGGAMLMNGDFQNGACGLLATVEIPSVTFADSFTISFFNCAVAVGNSGLGTGIDGILRRGVDSGLTSSFFQLDGGTNATPDASGQTDAATLTGNGCTVQTN